FQDDVPRRPPAILQNVFEHRPMVARHPGDVPGMHLQDQESGQRLPGGVDDVQRAYQSIQIDDGIFIEGDGIRRLRRDAVSTRTERLELGLMADDLIRAIEERFERAF
ncbi:hypothetical protein RZS08_44070, partial [Arthrospira platensis SPKY1]|nr:hypothetical protein [Arthrospira platensis SPKY1]